MVEALIEAHGRTNPVRRLSRHGASRCYMARTHVIGKRELKLRSTLSVHACH